MRQFLLFLTCIQVASLYAQFDPVPDFFRIQRELPLMELNTTQDIFVADYGAVINDGMNDIAGIAAALNAAVSLANENNPVRVVFENGTYDLMPSTGVHAFSISQATGLLLDGQGAEFILHNPSVGFLSLNRCTNTIVQNLSVDYAVLPFTQGKIINVNKAEGFFEFTVDEGFPLPTLPFFMEAPERWGMFKNENGAIKEGSRNLIPHNRFFESTGVRTYKYANQFGNLETTEVGDYFVHIGRTNGATIIKNDGGKNLTYNNITVHASPAGAFNAFNSEEWNVINCQVILKTGRVHTTNADVMHVNGGKIAPWVQGCTFEAFSDDCMNLKYTKRRITEIHSPTEITVQFNVQLGETVEFYNPRDGVFLGTALVDNIQNLGDNFFRITLSQPINITRVSTSSSDQRADQAYLESRSNESFIFRNNIVRNSRRYGLLIQNKFALIENNLFQNLSGSGIRIENGVDWGEGFRAEEIEIKNNVFDNCGFDTTFIDEENSASISVDFSKVKPEGCGVPRCGTLTTSFRAHSNIRIVNNTILYNKKGLYLKNIDGLSVIDNFVCHRGADMTLSGNENAENSLILNSANVEEVELTITAPNAESYFKLDEDENATSIINSGTNSNIALEIQTEGGGIITPGFLDSDFGNTFNIITSNNGNLRLVNATNGTPFPGPVAGAARTYTVWVKPSAQMFQTLLYSGGPEDGEVFAVQVDNAVVRVTDNAGNFVRMADKPLEIGEWNHIAVTLPENGHIHNVQLYKDGEASSVQKIGDNSTVNTASAGVEFFPKYEGLASDIRYFNYELCTAEIEAIYTDRLALSVTEAFQDETKTSVYPSLTNGIVYFSVPVDVVSIYDVSGKLVYNSIETSQTKMDLSYLSQGFYLLKVNNKETFKIFKK